MTNLKEQILAGIEAEARREAAILAGQFARAASEDREAILAALKWERWLAESCRDAIDDGSDQPY